MPTKLEGKGGFENVHESVIKTFEKEQSKENKEENIPTDVESVEDKSNLKSPKSKRRFSLGRFLSLLIIVVSVGFLTIGGAFVYNILAAANDTTGGGGGSFIDIIGQAIDPDTYQRVELEGESEGRTNLLVLGVDSAALLSDTIMVVSYYHAEKEIATMSIPRDMYVRGGYRVNAVYAFAERNNPGSGGQKTADFVSKELDIPIHYWLTVNFSGVEQIVDAVGGVEIDVTVPFTDYRYPTRNYSGYIRPAPSFKEGKQTMDGKTALIYARSRHGNNGTGSDFDRARRQAEIVEAVLQKLKDQIDSGEILNINSIQALISSAKNNVKTSAKINEIMSSYELFKELSEEKEDILSNFHSINWESGNGFLCTPPLEKYGASVVTYCDGTLAGTSYASSSRTRGQQQAKNLLDEARYRELSNASAIILANGSSKAKALEEQMNKTSIGKVWPAANSYRYIKKADGEEKITIYIEDETIRSQFKKASEGKIDFEFELKGALPSDKTLTSNNRGVSIIVWIE